MAQTASSWPARRWIPACVIAVLYGAMMAVHAWAGQRTYLTVLAWLGVTDAGREPFLDTQAVLSALMCHRLGIDVYVSNPCDVLGRPHAYTPFWLWASPLPIGTNATPVVGLLLDGMFVIGLLGLPATRRWRELLVMLLACASSTTAYALERANNDIVIWLLVLLVAALLQRGWPHRIMGYGVIVFAGLLKLYPLALLSLAAWEKPRWFFTIWIAALTILGVIVLPDLANWLRTGASAPQARHSLDMFGATNLPFGLADGLARFGWRAPWTGPALLAVVTLYAASLAVRMLRRLDLPAQVEHLSRTERILLLAGGVLLVGCFFTASNVFYRGIYFLFVLPGLCALWRKADQKAAFVCGTGAMVIPALMWAEGIRHALDQIALPFDANLLVWTAHELLLWWVLALLTALMLALLRRAPTGAWAWSLLPAGWRAA